MISAIGSDVATWPAPPSYEMHGRTILEKPPRVVVHRANASPTALASFRTAGRARSRASQPTSGADHRRLRVDPRRGWARRRRGSRGPLGRLVASPRAGWDPYRVPFFELDDL